jgi:hypothetical protein
LVNKLILASTLYKRDGMQDGFWEGLQHASLDNMPQPLKDAYLKANPDPKGLAAAAQKLIGLLHQLQTQGQVSYVLLSGMPLVLMVGARD